MIVTKPNRVLPLKMVCKDAAGKVLTDLDIAPPIVDVDYNGFNFIPEEVSEALFAGPGGRRQSVCLLGQLLAIQPADQKLQWNWGVWNQGGFW